MNIITLDFESHFSDDYSLSKMTTESYVRDPRFEAHGCSIRFPVGETRWFASDRLVDWQDGDTIYKSVLEEIDWSNTACLCHHTQFDGLILAHHFGIRPKLWLDTLSMARLLLGNHLGVGLDALAKHFGLAAKTVPYNLFKGKHWHELSPAVQQMVADGCCHDVNLTWDLFKILAKDFPKEEYAVIDLTVRMFTEPMLRGDVDLLAKIWEDENAAKAARMDALGIAATELQSSEKFAELLRDEGIEPETKDGKNGPIYAFAKTDQFMRDLQEDDNERVRTLAEARLGAKSTLLQTRAETLGWMARRGPMPVYLRYAGAGTLRFSGGDSTNFQNFKRGSAIRRTIMAPDGYLLAPIDSSQIECRVLNYLAGQDDMIDKFRCDEDPYVGLASAAYGETIYKPAKDDPRKEEMEAKRGMGKQGELMCGYGAGWKRFKATAKNGLYGPPVTLTDEAAQNFVTTYRSTHPFVCAPGYGYWAQANRMLARLAGGPPLQWGPLVVRDHRIYLPNRCPLIYDTLEWRVPPPDEEVREHERNGYWRVKTRQGWKTMWGSKLVQNICEAVSRVIVTQAAIRITRLGYRILNIPHDELLVAIPKDGREQEHLDACKAEMRKTPDWLPGIPLDCEGSLGERYSK